MHKAIESHNRQAIVFGYDRHYTLLQAEAMSHATHR